MHIGIWSINTDYGVPLHELAKLCEARGIESLWTGEHTHIPISVKPRLPESPYFQREIFHMVDPFISLAAAAAVTTTLKLGIAVCLVVERDPIVLAKTVATLDMVSEGRLLFGVSVGWIREEMENFGNPWARRWQIMEERITAMKAIWTQEEATYHSEFVNFERIVSYPKPVQKPYPPILLGSIAPRALPFVVQHCDGWCPIDSAVNDQSTLENLRQQAVAAGRDPAAFPVTLFTYDTLTAESVKRYHDMGIERIVAVCPLDTYLPFLDQTAEVIRATR